MELNDLEITIIIAALQRSIRLRKADLDTLASGKPWPQRYHDVQDKEIAVLRKLTGEA